MFTTTSNLCLGEYPQTVAGLIIIGVKFSDIFFVSILSQSTLNFE